MAAFAGQAKIAALTFEEHRARLIYKSKGNGVDWKAMRKEEFETKKFIHPNDEWQCFICLEDKPELDILGEGEMFTTLICDPCREKLGQDILEGKTLLNF